jgi:tetratricopeptide (TPR) repeat protein
MKKIISIALITVLLIALPACRLSKWDQSDPNMPDELRQQNEAILEENLTSFEENGFNVVVVLDIAISYEHLGDYKKAIEYYEQVLEYDVNHIVALNNMAAMYEEVEEYEEAAEYIKRLYQVRQDSVETVKDAVRILLKADDALNAQHALDNYKSKVLIDPENENYAYYEEVIAELQEDIDSE